MSAPIRFDAALTRDFPRASSREWLETNGLGSWSSATITGANTRRYHGLLVVATHPPVGRLVLLSRIDETLTLFDQTLDLGCSLFPGTIHPQGYRHLASFALDPFPTFTYATDQLTLRKTVGMVHGEHTVVIRYELLRAPEAVRLQLRPLFAGRDYHHLVQANDSVRRKGRFRDHLLRYQPYPGQPSVYLWAPGLQYTAAPDWHYNFRYPREEERGLEASEDLFTCGTLHSGIEPGSALTVIVSTTNPEMRDGAALLEQEATRRLQVPVPAGLEAEPVVAQLARAADQFLVRRNDGLHTVLAGYHWFTDWGRDTMISLPGLCLVTGRFDEARSIFTAFATHISQGMIPNRFPDYGEQPDYNTVDATLWFFVALQRYLDYTQDFDFVETDLWPALEDILIWHRRGTRSHIHVAADGLLWAGDEGTQLTWMDAKVNDWVVTPRHGKPVEVNALWYNALRVTERLAAHYGEEDLEAHLQREASRVADAFCGTFWNESAGCLYDVVNGSGADAAIRPNQILALSLPYPLLTGDRARRVFDTVDKHLFTPYGLRTLSPTDPAYRGRYEGGPWDRDGAYHQGTAWAWLMGPFITALVRVYGDAGRQRARHILREFEGHMCEAGLGTVSEIFDAEPPYIPRGCIAQAWSVAELLRAGYEDVLGRGPALNENQAQ